MKRNGGFDEIMIVNPAQPGLDGEQGARRMRFHSAGPPSFGYFAEPTDYGHYAEPPEFGYLAEEPPYGEIEPGYGQYEPVGYYGEPPEFGYLAEELPYGEIEPGYGQYEPVGYYNEPPELGYLAEEPPYGEIEPGYGEYEPVDYFADEVPYAGYAEDPPYGQVPEMVGYGQHEHLAEDYPGVGQWGEPKFSGYVRDIPSPFNAGCPMPANVSGVGEPQPLEGYVQPADVSPTCERFTPQPGHTPSVPETFKPLW